MATTRKYAHVRTRGLHWNPNDYIPTSLAAIHRQTPIFSSLIMDRWRRQAGRFANQPKSAITYPVANGINDPLTWAMLVDALLRLDPDTYINSAPLTAMLEPEYPQIIWDPVTVGRVLSELHAYARDLERPNKPFDEWCLFDRTANGSTRNYIIAPDEVSRLWLGCVREYLGQQAITKVEEWRMFGKEPRPGEKFTYPIAKITWGQRPEPPVTEVDEMRRKAKAAAKARRKESE